MFGPSPCPGHYPRRWANMAFADFCPVTHQVTLKGAMKLLVAGAAHCSFIITVGNSQ